MKNLLIITISLVLFASCKSEPAPAPPVYTLEGTVWKHPESPDFKLEFTETHATITRRYLEDGVLRSFTWPYTFDHPNLRIVAERYMYGTIDHPVAGNLIHKGIVRERTMEFFLQETGDTFMVTFLEMQ